MTVSNVPRMHACSADFPQARQEPPLSIHTMPQADARWYQPVAHEPGLRPAMSDQARCSRQAFSRAAAALLAERDGVVQPGTKAAELPGVCVFSH